MDSVPSWSPALILERIQATQIGKTEVSIAIVTAGSLGRRAVSWPPVPAVVLMVHYSLGLYLKALPPLPLHEEGWQGGNVHIC